LERNYQPPVLNQVDVSTTAKRTDAQLADIQFRLSGITRPLDLLLHQSIVKGPPTQEDVVEFVNSIHELLSDTASHITQIRIDNMFKSAGIRGQAPRLAANVATPLMEPKELLEHVNLAKSTMQLGRKGASQRRGKANPPRGPNVDQGKVHSQTAENVSNKSNNPFRKDFRAGQNQKDRGPPTSSK
jgi:hypothetical protein